MSAAARRRLGGELVDLVGVLAVWLLVGLPVGAAAVRLLTLAGYLPGTDLTAPLVVGAVLTAGVELLDARPTVARALAFAVTTLLFGLPVVALATVAEPVAALGRAVAVVLAWWLVLAGGAARTVTTARDLLGRVSLRPPARNR